MFRSSHRIGLFIFLLCTTIVQAGPVFLGSIAGGGTDSQGQIVVDLVPNQSGPYFGGEQITVDVWLTSSSAFELLLRRVQFDFSDTQRGLQTNDTFNFDFSSLTGFNQYHGDINLPIPWVAMTDFCVCTGAFMHLLPNSPFHIGEINVLLPTDDGTFVLDLLNETFPDPSFGGKIITAFRPKFPPFEYSVLNNRLVGGVTTFQVIPEPTTLSLLVVGCLFIRRTRVSAI